MEKMKLLFKNFPIQRKINFAIVFTCSMALGVTAVAIFMAQEMTFRHSLDRDLTATAEMISQTITASVAFSDAKGADDILEALKAKSHILAASVQLPDGAKFASYRSPWFKIVPVIPKADGTHVVGSYMAVNQPVMLKGERIATLRLLCDYQGQFSSSVRLYAGIMAAALLVSVILALLLSNRLQRLISSPILSLAESARSVAEKNDYSLRAPVRSDDEVGELTRAYNLMLDRIQAQDCALNLSQAKLEALVNSVDGIVWECVADTFQFKYVSRQCQRLLGYTSEQWMSNPTSWQQMLHREDALRAIQCRRTAVERMESYHCEYRMVAADDHIVWVRESGIVLEEDGQAAALRGVFMDITAQKRSAEEVDKLNRQLLETSRQAGMSDVATSVLHNVGNVLTSVNVSASLINDQLRNSKTGALTKACALLTEHTADLPKFFTCDPKGQRLPDFLTKVARCLEEERAALTRESLDLAKNVEHIKEIVAMQQNYARIAGVTEDLPPSSLVEDAVRINEGAFLRHGVSLNREFDPVPPVRVDKHKVLQILVNLFRNAKYAMDATGREDKILTIAVRMSSNSRVKIIVKDNGLGIQPENLTRIFSHGFTTKKEGHGFGLHSGANAARELGGSLQAFSDGPGTGATFVLELPVAPEINN